MSQEDKAHFVEQFIKWLLGEECSLPENTDELLSDPEIEGLVEAHPVVKSARENAAQGMAAGLSVRMPF